MRTDRTWLTRIAILLPYAWLVAFFLLPFFIVVKISLSQVAVAQPPYEPLLDFSAGWDGLKAFLSGLSGSNYGTLASDDLYLWSYLKSIAVAASRPRSCCSSAIRSPMRWRVRQAAIRASWCCSSCCRSGPRS
jgi:ABC-type spermidine/putrescine transport system permease subunit I